LGKGILILLIVAIGILCCIGVETTTMDVVAKPTSIVGRVPFVIVDFRKSPNTPFSNPWNLGVVVSYSSNLGVDSLCSSLPFSSIIGRGELILVPLLCACLFGSNNSLD
jgi:hypothetical protein